MHDRCVTKSFDTFSSKLPETPRYTLDVVRDEEKAQRNLAKVVNGEGNWDDDYFETTTADRCAQRKNRLHNVDNLLADDCQRHSML